ncbi:serine/threonine-protein kinase [Nocardiopsis sp. FIRDI 009]|uniref:serine/threonine-protein kinase n=2 Tax=Nocardiopsis TaxID=2013 RepID=UPI000E21D2CA|nr:serine/threonine-protein kinase [Nocardiopsis sp. FIRDI 009]
MTRPPLPPRVPPGLTPLHPTDPRAIPPFTVHGRLGAGGMGVVLAATDLQGAWVAIKVVRAEYANDPEFRARFASEIELMRRVRARCIAPVLAHDTGAPQPWYATAYLPGPTLGDRVRRGGALPLPRARVLAAGMAEAVAAIHASGVLHRDLKPSNVILAPDGPKVLDFGIARAVDETGLTRTGGLVGSPAWLSPERYRGVSGPEADVFAWGAMVAFAATGRPPFGNGGAETLMYRILSEEPDLDGLPEELAGPVVQALDKDPGRRPPAAELVHRVAGPLPDGPGNDDTTIVDGLIRDHWEPDTGDAEAASGATVPTPAPPPFEAPAPPSPPFPAATPRRLPHAAASSPVPPPAQLPVPTSPPVGGGARPRRRRLPVLLGAGALSLTVLGAFGLYAAERLAADGAGRDREPADGTPAAVEPAAPNTLSGELRGSGSSFAAAAVQTWAVEYMRERQPGVTVSYDTVGSGAGAEAFVAGETDFGVADFGLTDSQRREAEDARGCPVAQFPLVTGAVAVITATPAVGDMTLNARQLEVIYTGEATNYRDLPAYHDDPETIDYEVPDLEVRPVRHLDAASTARVFSEYLAVNGARWRERHGEAGRGTDWGSASVAAQGDAGVAQTIREYEGGIGFVNAVHLSEADLLDVAVHNAEGVPARPTPEGTRAATEQLRLDSDGTASLPRAVGDAYPIMRISHVFAFECDDGDGSGAALRDLWTYALSEEGSKVVEEAGYTPLGPSIGGRVGEIVARVGGG